MYYIRLSSRLKKYDVNIMQVVVAKEAVGNLGGLVRQLSLDQFENESRRMIPLQNDLSYPAKRFQRQKSPQGLHKKVRVSSSLRPCQPSF